MHKQEKELHKYGIYEINYSNKGGPSQGEGAFPPQFSENPSKIHSLQNQSYALAPLPQQNFLAVIHLAPPVIFCGGPSGNKY